MQPDEQADDQWLRGALFDVNLPSGMQQRLLASLRAEAADQTRLLDSPHSEAIFVTNEMAGDAATSEPVAQSVVSRDPQQTTIRSSRRQWATALALSIIALAALGVYQWTRPASTEQLARFTLGQLDRLLADETAWQTDFDQHLADLNVLEGQLQFNIRPIGVQVQSGGALADQCRVWKLYSLATHKVFFVFDFKQAHRVQSLTRQLQELNRSSGGWSLVAMQADGRILVVAVEGRVDSYLYQRQSA